MTDTNRTQITGRVNVSLRDRIAKVLFERDDEAQSGWNRGYAELPTEIQELWRLEADVVIAALGLREERLGDDIGHPHPQYRYVTEWTSEVEHDG